MRETVANKARRYLIEGRIIVTVAAPGHVEATARGAGTIYKLGYTPAGWWCQCPAYRTCCHLRALQTIAAPDTPHQPGYTP